MLSKDGHKELGEREQSSLSCGKVSGAWGGRKGPAVLKEAWKVNMSPEPKTGRQRGASLGQVKAAC